MVELADDEVDMQGTAKFGGGNIMVWGCMGWEGVGRLAEVEGKMNARSEEHTSELQSPA